MENVNSENIFKIHPSLRKFVRSFLLNTLNVNIDNTKAELFMKILKQNNGYDFVNSFILEVPYAGRKLKWELCFDDDDLSFAPDITLYDDKFLNGFIYNELIEKLPSWVKWNAENPKALITLIENLLKMFKEYQINLLKTDKIGRFDFEFSSLINMGLSEDNIEVFYDLAARSVDFLIMLDIDLSLLPSSLLLDPTKPSAPALLFVTYKEQIDGSTIRQPVLYLSTQAEHALSFTGSLTKYIPPFSSECCLLDYVPEIQKMLSDQIKSTADNFQLKRNYISVLLAAHLFNCIEFDDSTYSKATFLFDIDNFHWLLHITINSKFPREKPKWTLRSVHYMTRDQIISEELEDYPYSPRWCAQEMVQRALKYTINEKINSFKDKSSMKNQF